MSELNGVFVDSMGNIQVRKGDSGKIHVTGVPTDDDYRVSFAVVNPANGSILGEVHVDSDNSSEVDLEISTDFTEGLGVGRFFYGIKLTDSDNQEQTVLPSPFEGEDGSISIAPPQTFIVKPKLVEGKE